MMVDIAWQRAKWFFFLKAFVGVLLSCFQSVFQRELELLNSVDILSLYGAFGILLVGFESFLLSYLFWVIGGQLVENQPLLRQIYIEPPILSRDNLSSKKKENVMSVTGHRSKVMKKQALCQNGKMHIATNSPYFGLQDKASSGPIKKNNKTKN